MTSIFEHPWLGGLFSDPEGEQLWSAEVQISHYIAFEAALAEAFEHVGRVPEGHGTQAASAIRAMTPDMTDLRARTAQDGLPIPALIEQMRAAAGSSANAVHTGATSQDVLDSALALTLKSLTDLLIARLQRLKSDLSELDAKFGAMPMMGRTRMQAALAIKVSDRVKAWSAPLDDHIARFSALRPRIERLQLGGAVGTGAAFGEEYEAIKQDVARRLKLQPAPHVWHTDRTAIAEYGSALSLITGSIGKFGQDLCLMAQQGVDEVALSGGGGSSAMPHKSNPILAELLVTLARYNATQLAGLHQALVHEQERSGAAWMLEWMILPQMSITTCRALAAATELCGQITRLGKEDLG